MSVPVSLEAALTGFTVLLLLLLLLVEVAAALLSVE
jgi:hypothetical protein